MRKDRVQLQEGNIKKIKDLHSRGCRKIYIARYVSLRYGAHLTTAYRHLAEDTTPYQWSETRNKERRQREKLRDVVLDLLAEHEEITTRDISDVIGIPLTRINRLVVTGRNHKSLETAMQTA